MAFTLLYISLIVVVINFNVNQVEGCSCWGPDPTTEVCNSDITVNATVESVSYPEGNESRTYPVIYHLNVHNVIHANVEGNEPTIVTSFLPSNLCGLYLTEGATYILAGSVHESRYNKEETALGMILCSLHMYVSGGYYRPYHDEVNEILDQINCSNSPRFDNNVNGNSNKWRKRNQLKPSPRHLAKLNALRKLGLLVDREILK